MKTAEKEQTVKTGRALSIYLWAVLGTTLLSGALYLLFRIFPSFADWFNGTVALLFRMGLAGLTNLFPFSIAETLLIALPLLIVLMLYIGIRYRNRTFREALLYCATILSMLAIVFQLFVLAFAPGYYGKTVDEKLGIERNKVRAEELYETAAILIGRINEENDAVLYRRDGFSVMPYTVYEMNDKLIEAYEALSQEYDCIPNFYSTVKPVMLSEAMSYTHITGVYTFFTGEANINVNFPDYTLPYTAAHELAHQRGFAREDEANFIAFLVCLASEDSYIRYSGLVGMYEYVMSALYRADRTLYSEARGALEESVIGEQRAYSEFFKQYEDSTVGEVSESINNSYLQSQGTVGTASYGMVVDLAVAYFSSDREPE